MDSLNKSYEEHLEWLNEATETFTLNLDDIVKELVPEPKVHYEVNDPEDLYKLFLGQYKYAEEVNILYKKTSDFYKELMKLVLKGKINVKLVMSDLAEHFYGSRNNTAKSRVFRKLHRLLETGLFVRIQDDIKLNTHIYIPVLYFLPEHIFKDFYISYLEIDEGHELIGQILESRNKFIQLLNSKRKEKGLEEYIPGDYELTFNLKGKITRDFSVDPRANQRIRRYLKIAESFREKLRRTAGYLGGDLRFFLEYVATKNSRKLNYYLKRLDKRWLAYDAGSYSPAPLMFTSDIILKKDGSIDYVKVVDVISFILNLYMRRIATLKYTIPDKDSAVFAFKKFKRYIYMSLYFIKRDYPQFYKELSRYLYGNIEETILFLLFRDIVLDKFAYLPDKIWYTFYAKKSDLYTKEYIDEKLKENRMNPKTVSKVVEELSDIDLEEMEEAMYRDKICQYTKTIKEHLEKAEEELKGKLKERYEKLKEKCNNEPTKYNKNELENFVLDYYLIQRQVLVFEDKLKIAQKKERMTVYTDYVKEAKKILKLGMFSSAVRKIPKEVEYRFKYFVFRVYSSIKDLGRLPDKVLKSLNKFEFFMKVGGILNRAWKRLGSNGDEEEQIKRKERYKKWFNEKRDEVFNSIKKVIVIPALEILTDALKENERLIQDKVELAKIKYRKFKVIKGEIRYEIERYLRKYYPTFSRDYEFTTYINEKVNELLENYRQESKILVLEK